MKMKILAAVSSAATLLAIPLMVNAAPHNAGTNIVQNGTVFMLTADGQRRPYTSAGAFLSYGFNSWAGVEQANTDDLALPVGAFIPPRDGKIICSDRGTDKGTCYLITNGKRAGFVSEKTFKDLGFDFSKTLSGDVSFLDKDADISNSSEIHRSGVLINKNGTIYIVGDNGLYGIPSMETLQSWGYSLNDAIVANAPDNQLPQASVISARLAGQLQANNQTLDNTTNSTPYNFGGTTSNTTNTTSPTPSPTAPSGNTNTATSSASSQTPAPTLLMTGGGNVSISASGYKITWSSQYATNCTASGSWSGVKSISGEEMPAFAQTGNYTYTLNCTGSNGQNVENSITVNVIDTKPKITFSFNGQTTNNYTGKVGDTVRMAWEVQYANTCTASGNWSGSKTSGNYQDLTLSSAGQLTYTLTCVNPTTAENGSGTATVVVNP